MTYISSTKIDVNKVIILLERLQHCKRKYVCYLEVDIVDL